MSLQHIFLTMKQQEPPVITHAAVFPAHKEMRQYYFPHINEYLHVSMISRNYLKPSDVAPKQNITPHLIAIIRLKYLKKLHV